MIDLSHLTALSDDLPAAIQVVDDAFREPAVVDLDTLERRYLAWARGRPGMVLPELARQLGVSQRTLYRKLKGMQPGEARDVNDDGI